MMRSSSVSMQLLRAARGRAMALRRRSIATTASAGLQGQEKFSWTSSTHAHAPSTLLTLGIRAEDKNRWERRVPIVPDHVERLVKEHRARVIVQPSHKRVIPDDKFADAGAIISDDLSSCDVIIGVKEVPIDSLLPNKTYMFFSHTFKGQRYNMPLLKSILDKRIRLIDYELMKDENNRRLVLFSRFAGYAGFLDALNGLGHRLLALGYGNPFLACGISYMYRCLADARLDMTRTGQVISDDGLPRELGPLVFVFTGDGNVTKGALHVFKCLPHEWVKPDDLKKLVENKNFDNHKVYGCQVRIEDYIVPNDGPRPWTREEYYTHPERFHSVFHDKIAPHATVLVNGIFWDARYPRLLTIDQTRMLALEKRFRMLQIADISCDINGSLEFMSRATTIDKPFFMYDPITGKEHEDTEGEGVQIMSIDNLPTEMPLEASEYFGDALYPFIVESLKGNFEHPVLAKATIATEAGKLAPRHEGLYPIIAEHGVPRGKGIKVTSGQKVLVLGSGYVAAPLVDYLLARNHHLTIASNATTEANALSRNRASVAPLDVSDTRSLRKLIDDSNIVVSLVPASLHPRIADQCVDASKHMVTASYTSPAMLALHDRAAAAGVTLMNEIGLDPGIDHLTAMRAFDDVRDAGGRITGFVSWCGGLPAPEASNNPLGYKFSWSPKGVLLAGLNSAKYLKDGKFVDVDGSMLLRSAVGVDIYPGFALEGIPNRDSLSYIDTYGLDRSHLSTMFRGTLRYRGYASLMHAFRTLGLLDTTPRADIDGQMSWPRLLASTMRLPRVPSSIHEWRAAIARHLNDEALVATRTIAALEWMDILNDSHPAHASPTPLDAFCALLQAKLVYAPDERDMVIMHHEFGVAFDDGARETRTSTLVAYGDAKCSAMAKTVGLPAAMATEMILSGKIKRRGVVAPVHRDIYEPMLEELEEAGVKFVERSVRL